MDETIDQWNWCSQSIYTALSNVKVKARKLHIRQPTVCNMYCTIYCMLFPYYLVIQGHWNLWKCSHHLNPLCAFSMFLVSITNRWWDAFSKKYLTTHGILSFSETKSTMVSWVGEWDPITVGNENNTKQIVYKNFKNVLSIKTSNNPVDTEMSWMIHYYSICIGLN